VSVRLMSDAWENAPFEGPTLLLLIALADSANDDGFCWPSIPTLERKTRQPNRTVHHGLKTLCEAGWLEKVSNPGRGKSNYYRVLTPTVKGANHAGFTTKETVQGMQEKVQGMHSKGARHAFPIRKNRKGTVPNRNYTNYIDERDQMKRLTGVDLNG
jgi:Helix-turn-helix domain